MSAGTPTIRPYRPEDCAALCAMGAPRRTSAKCCDGVVAEFNGVLIGALPSDGSGPLCDRTLPTEATIAAMHRARGRARLDALIA